jgi:uncharacterized protein (DUF433 family)
MPRPWSGTSSPGPCGAGKNAPVVATICATFHAMEKRRFDPREAPAYSPVQAARWFRVPAATVRAWAKGQYYERRGTRHFFRPVIHAAALSGAAKSPLTFSFVNLVELHVLSALRRAHEIPLSKIRRSIEYLGRRYPHVRHPLADLDLLTDGLDVWLEELGDLVAVSHDGQLGIREIVAAHLQRVVRGNDGRAIRLYPFTRPTLRDLQPRVIVVDPEIAFGRPTLADSGIPTRIIAGRFEAGESFASLARDYERSQEEIEEAIRWERRAA